MANLRPLSALALSKANANKPLSASDDPSSSASLASDATRNAAKLLNANSQGQRTAKGVDDSKFNGLDSAFSANGADFDAGLDSVRVQFNRSASSCIESVTSPTGSTVVGWNSHLTSGGIGLSFTAAGTTTNLNLHIGSCKAAAAGTYSMLVDTTVSGFGVSIPQVCVDGVPGAPPSTADFCSGASGAARLRAGVQVMACDFVGNDAACNVRISSPLVPDHTVKYTVVKR